MMAEAPTPSPALLKTIRVLEFPTVLVAKTAAWLIIPMTCALVYEVVARYIFNAPTIWAYDVTYILAGSLFLGVDTVLGPLHLAYGQAERGHRSAYLVLGQTL